MNPIEVGDYYPLHDTLQQCIRKFYNPFDGFLFEFSNGAILSGREINWELVKLESEVN
jgi:hypothetical protein